MDRLSKWLIKQSKGWLVLVSLAVFALFMAFVLPDQAAKADEYARGSGSPDTSMFYTPAELFHLAELYGEAGRQAYVRARFSFDLAFPLVYGFFLVTILSWLVDNGLDPGNPWRKVNLFPVFGVIFDFMENIATSLVMPGYPERPSFLAVLAAIFTLTKWIFVYGSFFAVANVFMVWAVKKLRREP